MSILYEGVTPDFAKGNDFIDKLIAAELASGAIAATGDSKYAENPEKAVAVFNAMFDALSSKSE